MGSEVIELGGTTVGIHCNVYTWRKAGI
ncbi:uncharacterized protein G2W53_021500 [Senna tora]|uniref:Uncharacterized protein n=1 Tax=Senna tora TaxID=362788 RepID=A0A834WL65_9FABA|nr:uncharacterized protein G2W53_021500 [Senna tora]